MIPGIFFDINPSHRRNLFNSPCHHFVRLSFGPPIQDLDKGMHLPFLYSITPLIFHKGLDAIANVLKKAKKTGMQGFGHSYKKSLESPTEPAFV